jgi:hypothetical protein
MENQKTPSEAERFVHALETDKRLRQEALSIPRKHFLTLAEQNGYKVTGKELYEAMRQKWANETVPRAADVEEGDDPDTCCCSTFSESPAF